MQGNQVLNPFTIIILVLLSLIVGVAVLALARNIQFDALKLLYKRLFASSSKTIAPIGNNN